MAMVPGLSPNIRQLGEEPTGLGSLEDVLVEIDEGRDRPDTDDNGNIMRIEHDDGSISISVDGSPVEKNSDVEDAKEWFSNLVDDIDHMQLGGIADDLLRGVRDDLDSRND